jgi:hypothetical protein
MFSADARIIVYIIAVVQQGFETFLRNQQKYYFISVFSYLNTKMILLKKKTKYQSNQIAFDIGAPLVFFSVSKIK